MLCFGGGAVVIKVMLSGVAASWASLPGLVWPASSLHSSISPQGSLYRSTLHATHNFNPYLGYTALHQLYLVHCSPQCIWEVRGEGLSWPEWWQSWIQPPSSVINPSSGTSTRHIRMAPTSELPDPDPASPALAPTNNQTPGAFWPPDQVLEPGSLATHLV